MGESRVTLLQSLEFALAVESRKHYTPYNGPNARAYGCAVGGCPNKAFAKGMCNAHYIRARAGKSLDAPLRCWNRRAVCEKCQGATSSKGGWNLCASCFRNKRRAILNQALVAFLGGL